MEELARNITALVAKWLGEFKARREYERNCLREIVDQDGSPTDQAERLLGNFVSLRRSRELEGDGQS